mgnify:CR=1 FL=1
MGQLKSCFERPPDGINTDSRNYCCFFSTTVTETGKATKDKEDAKNELDNLKARLEIDYGPSVSNL